MHLPVFQAARAPTLTDSIPIRSGVRARRIARYGPAATIQCAAGRRRRSGARIPTTKSQKNKCRRATADRARTAGPVPTRCAANLLGLGLGTRIEREPDAERFLARCAL